MVALICQKITYIFLTFKRRVIAGRGALRMARPAGAKRYRRLPIDDGLLSAAL